MPSIHQDAAEHRSVLENPAEVRSCGAMSRSLVLRSLEALCMLFGSCEPNAPCLALETWVRRILW